MKESDKESEVILNFINKSHEPFETKEIEEKLHETRARIFYKLMILVGKGLIKCKQIGSGKGTWIWWKNE